MVCRAPAGSRIGDVQYHQLQANGPSAVSGSGWNALSMSSVSPPQRNSTSVQAPSVSVKSSGTRVFSLFGLILGLVDPGLGRHRRRMGPTTEPRRVGMVGRRQGLLPGLVDRVGSPEMHR